MRELAHALYPGSFDVLTYGHLDLVRRAARIFSKVTVAVARNPAKLQPLFTSEERVQMLREAVRDYGNVFVADFSGLTVDLARSIDAHVILRGLRAVSDFEYELQMAMTNDSLAPEITTFFMAPAPQYSFLSSSMVREVAAFGGDIAGFVPPHVAQMLGKRMPRTP